MGYVRAAFACVPQPPICHQLRVSIDREQRLRPVLLANRRCLLARHQPAPRARDAVREQQQLHYEEEQPPLRERPAVRNDRARIIHDVVGGAAAVT